MRNIFFSPECSTAGTAVSGTDMDFYDETKTRVHETEGDLGERDKKLFERERQLADISEDIETIASRPVAGPVFRLLTKGKLRI